MRVLRQWNGLRAIADVDFEPLLARGDRQALIAELADDVEGFLHRLLERESQRVRGHRALDLGADMRRRLEEAICGDQSVESLVWSLEVVVRQVVDEALLRVDGVGKDCPAEKLIPQRLPEALDLAERLRMLRPAADVVNPHPPECLFEFGLAAPHRVLPAVVGQHLGRLATALVTARKNASPYELVLEALGGAFGGKFGSHVPDILEPAVHSHHRDVMHSVTVMSVLIAKGQKRAMRLVEDLRERADDCAGRRDTSTDQFERLLLVLAESVCRLAAGFVAALVPGYISHLALDATTPRGIPLLAARIL